MTLDLQQLASDVRRAASYASAEAAEVRDDGSCSADMVHIPTGGGHPIGRRSAHVRDILEEAGSVIDRDYGVWRGYLINPGHGMVSARLQACETMARELKQYGATVYYRRD